MVKLVANRARKKAFGFDDMLFAETVLIGKGEFHRSGNDTAFPADG